MFFDLDLGSFDNLLVNTMQQNDVFCQEIHETGVTETDLEYPSISLRESIKMEILLNYHAVTVAKF